MFSLIGQVTGYSIVADAGGLTLSQINHPPSTPGVRIEKDEVRPSERRVVKLLTLEWSRFTQ